VLVLQDICKGLGAAHRFGLARFPVKTPSATRLSLERFPIQ
jgi:hypothetical protein